MKYVFFGTPRFAEIVLKGLIDGGLAPAAVVCNPDRPVGRKKVMTAPPVKVLAEKYGIRVLQPEAPRDAASDLAALQADCFVVAAYAKIIPASVLEIPRFGTLGTHPSLLPKYRGASPIQSAILAGESKTGSTIYQMDEKMDHGPILGQETISLDALTADYAALEGMLAELSSRLLLKILPFVGSDKITPAPQDESAATFTKKFTTEDGFVSEEDLNAAEQGKSAERAQEIVHKINAFSSEPGVWTRRNGKRIKLLKAMMAEGGTLKLFLIQEEGQKPKAP